MTVTTPDAFASTLALSFSEREYLVGDCILEGVRTGEWEPFSARAAAGVAAARACPPPDRDRLAALSAAIVPVETRLRSISSRISALQRSW